MNKPIKTREKEYELLPKQLEFINAEEKEVLMSGAWGSSKSFALCLGILREACIPNAQILLCRKTYTALKRSTLQTLLFGDNPIIPRNTYTYNKNDQRITMNGSGADIYLMGLDDIMKIRSMNLSYVAVDEATELTEGEWVELRGRLRSEHGTRRITGACNPASPSHWLYERFFNNTKASRRVIKSSSLDNPYLPVDYIESLKDMPPALYERFVLGEWVALEKAIYSQFSRDKHIKSRDFGEFTHYMLGVDFGFTNPCALTFMGVDGDNNVHLIEEVKETQLLIGDIVEKAMRYYKLRPKVIVDPSAPALIAEFEKEGFDVKKADNSVDSGIARFQDYLHKGKFTCDSSCFEFIKEIENYVYDDKGKPVKTNDHILDAIRYCLNESISEDVYIKPRAFFGIGEDDGWDIA